MANVFQVPGVPSLGSYLAGGLSFLTNDFASLGAIFGQTILQWGVLLNGAPVILPQNPLSNILQPLGFVNAVVGSPIFPVTASFVDIDYKQDWPISDYPVEQGGFQSYDKVQLPFALRLRLAVSGNPTVIELFQSTIQTMASDTSGLYEIVTPSQIYPSCSVTHYDYHRSATNGVSLLVVDLWFIEVRVTATSIFGNTLSPAFAGGQSTGIVQPQTP
jgi:hypothetical protein